MTDEPAGWRSCRDDRYGFVVRHPPDWVSTTEPGRCAQLRKGTATLPEGVPEVDVSFQVRPLAPAFPATYLRGPTPEGGVEYTDRRELDLGDLPAVRARFRSGGPTPNWGVEYAVRKGDRVLHAYVSQPSPEVESQFDLMMATLRW